MGRKTPVLVFICSKFPRDFRIESSIRDGRKMASYLVKPKVDKYVHYNWRASNGGNVTARYNFVISEM